MVILGMFSLFIYFFVDVISVFIVLQSYRTATISWVKFHSTVLFGGSVGVQCSN